MVVNAFWREPRTTAIGVVLILLGVPVYYMFRSAAGGLSELIARVDLSVRR